MFFDFFSWLFGGGDDTVVSSDSTGDTVIWGTANGDNIVWGT